MKISFISPYVAQKTRTLEQARADIEANARMERGTPWMRCKRCGEWCWPDASGECQLCRKGDA